MILFTDPGRLLCGAGPGGHCCCSAVDTGQLVASE